MVIPIKSTKLINQRLKDGWQLSKTIRMGWRFSERLWVDFIFEKALGTETKDLVQIIWW